MHNPSAGSALWQNLLTAPKIANLASLYLDIFPTAMAYWLWSWVLQKINLVNASLFTYLTPIFSALLASILLNERPGLELILGGACILLGVAMSTRPTNTSDFSN